ncbi:MAG: DNA-binding domain-containing protein [Pseudomonadota bacterium]
MSDLAERQEAFLRSILDEDAPLPDGWGNSQAMGMTVYRGNYRSALMGALAETYERTALCLGPHGFAQGCINHAIAHPPSGWTIDEAGAGFDRTLAELFPDRPEITELAWLEWTMMQLATAPNMAPVSAQDFAVASAEFGDGDWGELRIAFQPRAKARLVNHDLETLWRALGSESEAPDIRLETQQTCIVSREAERPTFRLFEADHAAAVAAMQDGATYGELIELLLGKHENPKAEQVQAAAMRAGGMLGLWLKEGWIVAINP